MVGETKPIKEILKTSKLLTVNTLASLMILTNKGICKIDGYRDDISFSNKPHLGELRAKLDVYSFMLSEVQKAFDTKKVQLPIGDLVLMASTLESGSESVFLLDERGAITAESAERIFSQCSTARNRNAYFKVRVDCLIQFLLQLVLDHLSYDDAKKMKIHYRKLVS
jgi:hypothetical protein